MALEDFSKKESNQYETINNSSEFLFSMFTKNVQGKQNNRLLYLMLARVWIFFTTWVSLPL